jgi:hypothetical protein
VGARRDDVGEQGVAPEPAAHARPRRPTRTPAWKAEVVAPINADSTAVAE